MYHCKITNLSLHSFLEGDAPGGPQRPLCPQSCIGPSSGRCGGLTALFSGRWPIASNSLQSETQNRLCWMVQELEGMYEECVREMDPAECEVLYGRAGYLSAILFASKYTGRAPKKEIVQV